MITIKDLKKYYELDGVEVKALDGVDLTIKRGEFVVIFGQSGCGKSTLLNILGGMDKPTAGEVFIDNENLAQKKSAALAKYRKEKIGMIFQKFNLIGDMSVLENVMLPLKFSGKSEKDQKKVAFKMIEQVGLANKIKSIPAKLSGGQQQRVAIARALVNKPDILLCDEPTGNLDSKTGAEILDLLLDLNKEGRTIIMVTHNEEFARHADHVIKMLDGKIIEEKNKSTIKTAANTKTMSSRNINFFSAVKLAIKNVNRRKLRVFLTSFGISIGAMAVLILVSFGAGIQKEATDQIKAFGQVNQIDVSSSKVTGANFRASGEGNAANSFVINQSTPLNDSVISDFQKIENVAKVFPSIRLSGEVDLADKAGKMSLLSALPLGQDQSALTGQVKYGQFFNADDDNSAIVPYGLAQALGFSNGQDIIGQTVTLKTKPDNNMLSVKIVGVFDEANKEMVQTYIPNITAANFQKTIRSTESQNANPSIYDSISVVAKDSASVDKINQALIDKGYSTHNYADTAKTINRVFVMLQVGLGVVGGIAMLVAALGIINTMMMSILERTREIGVMKAVGARERDIKSIFLAEAASIGLIGGVVGLLLGYPGSKVAAAIFNKSMIASTGGQPITFVIAPYLAIGVLVFSIFVAILAGFFPARRGAALDPVIALRDE